MHPHPTHVASSDQAADNIYHSAHTVRLNKKIQNISHHQQQQPVYNSTPQQQPLYSSRQQQEPLYNSTPLQLQQQQPLYSTQQQIYSPQLQHRQQHCGIYSPLPQQQQQPPCCNSSSDPIDEAVRLLEHSAAMLQ